MTALIRQATLRNNTKIYVQDVALDFEDGYADFFLHKGNVGRSSLHNWDNDSDLPKIKVRTRTGVNFVLSGASIVPNVIKLDVEGNEHRYLLGMSEILKNERLRAVIFEDSRDEDSDVKSLLRRNGFAVKTLVRMGQTSHNLENYAARRLYGESEKIRDARATVLVSVLIPCLNAQEFIGPALESVLAQTYAAIEIIVVDDGSRDASCHVVRRYDERGVRLFAQDREGAAAARNRALMEARGAFVLFLDADDLISPEHIELLVSRLVLGDDCIAMGEWDRFVSDPTQAKFPPRRGYCDSSGVDWLVAEWSSGQPMTQCGAFLIPRGLLDRLGGWDRRLSLIDDFEFFARLVANSGGLRFAPGARLYYRSCTGGSLSGRRSRSAAESSCLSQLLGTAHLLRVEDSARTRKACANVLQNFEFEFYPAYPALRRKMRYRIAELGGGELEPTGPPTFHRLRRWIGWRAARHVQFLAERFGLNRAARLQSESRRQTHGRSNRG